MLLKHKKTGGVYRVTALAVQEATMEPTVVYCCVNTGAVWTRPAKEFFDGRFEPYFPPKTAPDGGYVQ